MMNQVNKLSAAVQLLIYYWYQPTLEDNLRCSCLSLLASLADLGRTEVVTYFNIVLQKIILSGYQKNSLLDSSWFTP